MILAPLRGVTIRTFRKVFARALLEAGFTEAITPFISALPGVDPLKDRELAGIKDAHDETGLKITPQFIGKEPEALKASLRRIKAAGMDTADLNCGCPFPMVRNKGRGSGLLRDAKTFEKMLAVGCEIMGEGKFSIKARLGVERNDELLALMPIINRFPLRMLTVHARNARQMYAGECDWRAYGKIKAVATVPILANGDLNWRDHEGMVGRSFIRDLALRDDIVELLREYIAASREEFFGDRPILGRMKELIAYWREAPVWGREWKVIKLCRSVQELESCFPHSYCLRAR